MNTKTIRTLSLDVLVAAALLVAMWAASLWIYERERMSNALDWRWAELNNEPLFEWTFDSPWEITKGNGLRDFTWSQGTLSGSGEDPYFFLNLQGRYIDAARFTEIRLRLLSEGENTLRLFHQQQRADQIHASELVPLAPGWQTITLSLPALNWHVRPIGDPNAPVAESSWGGDDAVVTELRIDPVTRGAFEIDRIELLDMANKPRVVNEIEPFSGKAGELSERMRAEPGRTWHVAREGWLRTPESDRYARRTIAREFPSAVVLPRVPTADELAFPPFNPGAASVFIPASIFIAALLILVVRDQVPQPWRSVVAVIALIAALEAYVYWLPHLSGYWRVLLAVPLVGALWELAPRKKPRYLLGDNRAWLLVSPIIVLALLVLIVAPFEALEVWSEPKAVARQFLWSLVQLFVVAVVVMGPLREVSGKTAIVLGAGVLGFLHFPNFALMTVTFLLGLILLHVYERHQNLLAIAVAQTFIAVSFDALALKFFWLSRAIGPAFTAGL